MDLVRGGFGLLRTDKGTGSDPLVRPWCTFWCYQLDNLVLPADARAQRGAHRGAGHRRRAATQHLQKHSLKRLVLLRQRSKATGTCYLYSSQTQVV